MSLVQVQQGLDPGEVRFDELDSLGLSLECWWIRSKASIEIRSIFGVSMAVGNGTWVRE